MSALQGRPGSLGVEKILMEISGSPLQFANGRTFALPGVRLAGEGTRIKNCLVAGPRPLADFSHQGLIS